MPFKSALRSLDVRIPSKLSNESEREQALLLINHVLRSYNTSLDVPSTSAVVDAAQTDDVLGCIVEFWMSIVAHVHALAEEAENLSISTSPGEQAPVQTKDRYV